MSYLVYSNLEMAGRSLTNTLISTDFKSMGLSDKTLNPPTLQPQGCTLFGKEVWANDNCLTSKTLSQESWIQIPPPSEFRINWELGTGNSLGKSNN